MPLVRPCVLLAAACLSLGSVVPAFAQVSAEQVNDAVASLASGDRDKVADGRTKLLANLNAVRSNAPALATFSQNLGNVLMPIASGNDPHAKLNAAIVVQRTAEQSGSADLAAITAKLIGDASPAVSAYGLRAASNILPRQFADPKSTADNPIVGAIVSAVNRHPESEAVASEAYNAIVRLLSDRTANETLTPLGVATATPKAVDAIHKLLAARIAQYGSGSLAEPAAELPAISFLGKQNIYNASSPAQRMMTIRLLLDLMDGAAAEMAKLPANAPTSRIRLTDLRNLVKGAGGSLSVITSPELMNKPDLKTAAQKVQQLGLATPVGEYRQLISTMAAEFHKQIPETRSTTQPTTGPAPAPASKP